MAASLGKVRFDYVHERNIGSVKKLLQVTLPIEYPASFYDALVASPQDLTQLVFFNEVLVGVVGCKVEALDGVEEGAIADKQLYIAAMAILPAYRDMGLGTKALAHVLANAKGHKDLAKAYLHVHAGNAEAQKFYKAGGFTEEGSVPGYFPRLTPPDALILSQSLQ